MPLKAPPRCQQLMSDVRPQYRDCRLPGLCSVPPHNPAPLNSPPPQPLTLLQKPVLGTTLYSPADSVFCVIKAQLSYKLCRSSGLCFVPTSEPLPPQTPPPKPLNFCEPHFSYLLTVCVV